MDCTLCVCVCVLRMCPRCRHKTWAVTARPGTLCKPLWGTSATDPCTKEVPIPLNALAFTVNWTANQI